MTTTRHRFFENALGYAALLAGAGTLALVGDIWGHHFYLSRNHLPVPSEFFLNHLCHSDAHFATLALLAALPISFKSRVSLFVLYALLCIQMMLLPFLCLCSPVDGSGDAMAKCLLGVAGLIALVRVALWLKKRHRAKHDDAPAN